MIARCGKGRLDSLEIPGRATFLAAASQIEQRSSRALPSTEEGQQLIGTAKDLWGNPLLYQLIDSTHARIFSAGPDRLDHTQWDIGLVIEKVTDDAAAAADTWLGRRKAELGIQEAPTVAGFKRNEFSGGQSKLEGAAYFRFFTWLILVTTLIYIPFAYFYKPKTFLHD